MALHDNAQPLLQNSNDKERLPSCLSYLEEGMDALSTQGARTTSSERLRAMCSNEEAVRRLKQLENTCGDKLSDGRLLDVHIQL